MDIAYPLGILDSRPSDRLCLSDVGKNVTDIKA
nr:MAG TPA: hypothetical protein [Caudoviricetes sp.]